MNTAWHVVSSEETLYRIRMLQSMIYVSENLYEPHVYMSQAFLEGEPDVLNVSPASPSATGRRCHMTFGRPYEHGSPRR